MSSAPLLLKQTSQLGGVLRSGQLRMQHSLQDELKIFREATSGCSDLFLGPLECSLIAVVLDQFCTPDVEGELRPAYQASEPTRPLHFDRVGDNVATEKIDVGWSFRCFDPEGGAVILFSELGLAVEEVMEESGTSIVRSPAQEEELPSFSFVEKERLVSEFGVGTFPEVELQL